MKIAIFYDWLNQWGGAERVLLDLLEIYPQADIYTLIYDPQKTSWLPKGHKIISLNLKNKLLYTPFYAYKMEQVDFSSYDLLISTTSTIGHCFLTLPQTLFICYYHNINRYLYQNPPLILRPLLKKYQKIDKIYASRPDYIFCNSQNVAKRIQANYQRPTTVIYPGIDTKKFFPNQQKPKNYFLIVSRLVAHKNIDLVIKTFRDFPYFLKIVGVGRDQNYLKSLAKNNKNIEFLGNIDDHQLVSLYQNCLGLIHPQEEDFGLSALEVQACGRGVVAYQKGGALETIIDHKTGIFFSELNENSLFKALNEYLKHTPNSRGCQLQASRFDHKNFMLNFKQQVDTLCSKND
ncbi:MAG: glycosyltransferase [Candidatus Shapirobacteria bacterium]